MAQGALDAVADALIKALTSGQGVACIASGRSGNQLWVLDSGGGVVVKLDPDVFVARID